MAIEAGNQGKPEPKAKVDVFGIIGVLRDSDPNAGRFGAVEFQHAAPEDRNTPEAQARLAHLTPLMDEAIREAAEQRRQREAGPRNEPQI